MFNYHKYIIYGSIIVIVLISATVYIVAWKHSIRQQAMMDFTNSQLKKVIEEQNEFNKKIKEISNLQQTIYEDMRVKNEQLEMQLNDLEGYLNAPETEKNDSRISSDVLRNTIRELSK